MNKPLPNPFKSGCSRAFYSAVLLLLCTAGARASTRTATANPAPTLTITRSAPSPTNAKVLNFQAVFSEVVSNVDPGDFIMTNSFVTTGAISVTNTGDNKTYNIRVASVSGNGTARLDLKGGTDIIDAAGNSAAGFTGGEVYSVDQTAPRISAFGGTSPPDPHYPTKATSLVFTITFTEVVTGVDLTDFRISNSSFTGTAKGSISSISGSGNTYMITVSNVSGNGDLSLLFKSSGTGIADLAGNPIDERYLSSSDYIIDNTPPVLTANYYYSSNGNPHYARVGDKIILIIRSEEEALKSETITISGKPVSNTFVNIRYEGVYTLTQDDTEGNVPWTFSGTDYAGNVGNLTNTDAGTVLIFDKTPPAANISAPSQASTGSGSGNLVTYNVTYSDANFNFSTLSPGDITLNTTGTATGTVGLSGSGTSYTVTISNITGLGTLGISIGAGTAQDMPGNTALASAPSPTVAVVPTDALLSNLVMPQTLTPAFNTNTFDYTFAVLNSVTSTTVTPTAADAGAAIAVQVNGGGYSAVTGGSTSGPLLLNTGSNTIDVRVTAQDGTAQYRVKVTRRPLAILKSIRFEPPVELATASGPDYMDYKATVGNSVTEVKVKPVAIDANNTITVNNVVVASGSTSGAISLAEGDNTIVISVTDGTVTNNYSVKITRLPPVILAAFTFSPDVTLIKVSGPDYADYKATVGNTVSSVTVTPKAGDASNTITVNNVVVASGTASAPITLNLGDNTIVMSVTDGTTTKTYSMKITRLRPAVLETIRFFEPDVQLTKVAGADYADYKGNVANSVASVRVMLRAGDVSNIITVNNVVVASGSISGAISLSEGDNTIVLSVTDGTVTNNYSVKIRRLPPAALASFTFSPDVRLTKVSGTAYENYTAVVDERVGEVTVTPIAADPDNTIIADYDRVPSGTESFPISLRVGDNLILITVTDGTVTNTYSITIRRRGPPTDIIAYEAPKEMPVAPEVVTVHQNVSPNGDGRGDAMQIDGIANYPDNKLQIMSTAGNLVYEAKGYDNTNIVFDGHGNNGKLQQAGTYYYSLEYKVGNETKRKTGYIVLKY